MGSLITLFKSALSIMSVVKSVIDIYNKFLDWQIEKHYQKKKDAMARLVTQIEEAKNDETRKKLVKRLSLIKHSK